MQSTKYRVSICLFLPLFSVAQQPRVEESLEVQIDRIMRARFAAGDFSGTVLVSRDGKVLYQHAFGLANREWNILNDLETKTI